jgi:hypothetical protein
MWQTDWAENTQPIARSTPENLSILESAAVMTQG